MIQLFTNGERHVEIRLSRTHGDDMKVKGIAITYGRKFNLGDYNSLELRVTFEGDLEPQDDPDGATKHLFAMAKQQVKDEYMLLFNQTGPK